MTRPRWHARFPTSRPSSAHNAPKHRGRTPLITKSPLTAAHRGDSLHQGRYAVRRPNSTPATTTDTAMMPALHATAAQAAAPGA